VQNIRPRLQPSTPDFTTNGVSANEHASKATYPNCRYKNLNFDPIDIFDKVLTMICKEGAGSKDPQKQREEYANKTGFEQHWECLLDEDTLFDFSWPKVQSSKLRGNLLPSINLQEINLSHNYEFQFFPGVNLTSTAKWNDRQIFYLTVIGINNNIKLPNRNWFLQSVQMP
jgi:hypothetical protein